MFSLAELEDAQRLVHRSFPGTAQYPWPLLRERRGALQTGATPGEISKTRESVPALAISGVVVKILRLAPAARRPVRIVSKRSGASFEAPPERR